jgi:hypothetical protein
MKTRTSLTLATLAFSLTALAQQPPPGGGGNRPPPPSGGGGQQRPPQGPPGGGQQRPTPPPPGTTALDFDLPEEVASIDGSGNNLANPTQGAAGQVFRRMVPAAYENGTDSPSGSTRPSARAISNALAARPEGVRPN